VKSRAPVSISYTTTPNAQMSARLLGRHVGGRPENHPHRGHRRRRDRRRVGVVHHRVRPFRAERFGESEVEHFDRAVRARLHVRGFQIAMDDAVLVGRFEGGGHLSRDGEGVGDRQRSLRDARLERRAVDELHHERVRVA
jgi:hypothetical protein